MPKRFLFLTMLILLLATSLHAQEQTEEAPPPTNTLLPSETFTEAPTITPTPIPTEPPTATFTETPSETPTETATSSETPTATSELSATVTSTATFTETPSLTPSLTSTPTPIVLPTTTPITPTWEEIQAQGALALQMAPVSTLDYVVVSNVSELGVAIGAGNDPAYPNPYRIFMKAGTYALTSALPAIERHIKIYGMGIGVTIITTPAPIPSDAIFRTRFASSRLELYDLTISGTGMGYGGYGGILYGGNFEVYSSVLEKGGMDIGGTDVAVIGGGAIYNASNLTIKNSILRQNTAGLGGAIMNDNGIGTVSISCTRFEANTAPWGGGYYYDGDAQAVVTITNSVFQNNVAAPVPEGALRGGAIHNLKSSYTFPATGNWWPTWPNGGPPTSLSNPPNTDTVNSFVAVSPIAPGDPLLPGGTDDCNLRPTLETTSAAEELQDYYGVQIVNNPTGDPLQWDTTLLGWTTTDADQIRIGVRNTALALGIQSGRSPIDAFILVMRRRIDEGDGVDDGWPYIVSQKTGSSTSCLTTANVPTTIDCGTGVIMSEYTFVHELGHVFDNRSDQGGNLSLEEYVATTNQVANYQPVWDYNIGPGGPRLVMGVFYNEALANSTPSYWDRGPRGWGTGPASNYDVNGVAISSILTSFQQHSPPYAQGPQSGEANKETGADLFLNWVYRKADPNLPITNPAAVIGFRNISWDPWASSDLGQPQNACLTTAGCADNRRPGDRRFDWMNDTMTTIFSAHSW